MPGGQASGLAVLAEAPARGLDVVLAHEGPLGLKALVHQHVRFGRGRRRSGRVDAGLAAHGYPGFQAGRRQAPVLRRYGGPGHGHFEVYGCAGEVRSAKGYLILWHNGAGRLADALHDPVARSRRWPRDLFELAGLPAVTLPGAVKTPPTATSPATNPGRPGRRPPQRSSSKPSSGGCGTSSCSMQSGSGPIRSPGARTWRPGRGGPGPGLGAKPVLPGAIG